MNDVKYPDVEVQLSKEDGNAFAIMGRCSRAARRAGLTEKQIDEFLDECKSGNYDHLLQACMKYFNCH